METAGGSRAIILTSAKMALRFGMPLIGLIILGDAVVRSVGGDIEHGQFAFGALFILAGFASKLVPRP